MFRSERTYDDSVSFGSSVFDEITVICRDESFSPGCSFPVLFDFESFISAPTGKTLVENLCFKFSYKFRGMFFKPFLIYWRYFTTKDTNFQYHSLQNVEKSFNLTLIFKSTEMNELLFNESKANFEKSNR